jgi:hypothetical protein
MRRGSKALRVALCGREIFDGIPAKAEMKLFVGVTNDDWFRFLAERNPEEVNFWRPRSQNDFKALKSGDTGANAAKTKRRKKSSSN